MYRYTRSFQFHTQHNLEQIFKPIHQSPLLKRIIKKLRTMLSLSLFDNLLILFAQRDSVANLALSAYLERGPTRRERKKTKKVRDRDGYLTERSQPKCQSDGGAEG